MSNPMSTVSIGFYRKNGDFVILATMNNLDRHMESHEFEFAIKHTVATLEFLGGYPLEILYRQDAPDYINDDSFDGSGFFVTESFIDPAQHADSTQESEELEHDNGRHAYGPEKLPLEMRQAMEKGTLGDEFTIVDMDETVLFKGRYIGDADRLLTSFAESFSAPFAINTKRARLIVNLYRA